MINVLLNHIKKFFNIGVITSILILFLSNFLGVNTEVTNKIIIFFEVVLVLFILKNIFIESKNIKFKKSSSVSFLIIINFLLVIYAGFRTDLIQTIFQIILAVNLLFFVALKNQVSQQKKSSKYGFLILFLIIIGFTLIKVPYLNKNFTGNNTMKYNTYVEPAKHIVETNVFLPIEKRYRANPIDNPKGVENPRHLPVMEWTLAIAYKIFGMENITIVTRIYMHLVGIFTLIASYFLIKKTIDQFTALIFVSLLSINPLFALVNHLTIYDSLLMISFVVSYLFYHSYKENKKMKYLAAAGIILGLANLMKNSVIMWSIPALALDNFLINRFKMQNFFKDMGMIFIFIVLSIAAYLIPLTIFSTSDVFSIILFIILNSILYISIKNIKIIGETLDKIINYLFAKKYLLFSILGVFIFAILYVLLKLASSWSEFFTDADIIFFLPMYDYILKVRQLRFVNYLIFAFSILGFLFLFLNKNKKAENNVLISFLFGAMFYFVFNSKVIFFHNYYSIHIIYVYLMLASFFISKLLSRAHILLKYTFLISLFLVALKINQGQMTELLDVEKEGFRDVVEYVKSNTLKDEFYVDDSHTLSISIETNNPSISHFTHKEIQNDIEKFGFHETMKKYKIKYLITNNLEPSYLNYAAVFTNLELNKINGGRLTRGEMILGKYGALQKIESEEDKKLKLILENKAKEIKEANYFQLETVIGSYKIYNLYGT